MCGIAGCYQQADGQKLAGLEIQGRWVDVRDPETLAGLEKENIEH